MLPRTFAIGLAIASLFSAACGGGPRAATTDLGTIRQPTPDPTLDAVVRDLPRALAGVIAPTPTATLVPTVLSTATPKPKPAAPSPTPRPAARTIPPTATAIRPRP